MALKANLLLEALSDADRSALKSCLTSVDLAQHHILFDVNDTIEAVYFPTDAAISLVIPLSTGEVVETAMVGRDGVVGAAAALNGRRSLNRAIVQIGGNCLVCQVEPLKALLQQRQNIRSLIGAHEQALFAQAQQSAACNATHVVESRFARWLLSLRSLRERCASADAGIHCADARRATHERHSGRPNLTEGRIDPVHTGPYQDSRQARARRNRLRVLSNGKNELQQHPASNE